ncbi:MAG: Glucose-6-phosphate 1-dehydrogenase, partial [Planctomycetota bacterium]
MTDPVLQIVILGASGDLTARKLVPAVFASWSEGFFTGKVQLVGVARRPWGDAEFRAQIRPAMPKGADPARWEA